MSSKIRKRADHQQAMLSATGTKVNRLWVNSLRLHLRMWLKLTAGKSLSSKSQKRTTQDNLRRRPSQSPRSFQSSLTALLSSKQPHHLNTIAARLHWSRSRLSQRTRFAAERHSGRTTSTTNRLSSCLSLRSKARPSKLLRSSS